ncbi:MAG: hypothetical protein ACK59J_04810, partial [Pseudanabaena sp.]
LPHFCFKHTTFRGRQFLAGINPMTRLGALRAAILFLGFDFVLTQSTVAITNRIKATQIAAFILLG